MCVCMHVTHAEREIEQISRSSGVTVQRERQQEREREIKKVKKGSKEADLPCLSYKSDVHSADSG